MWPPLPASPAMEATLTMRPARRGSIERLPTAWLKRKTERTLRFMTLSQASSGWSSAGAPQVAPALLTRMSIWPRRSIVSATTRCASSGLAASAAIQRASMPRACRWAVASSRSAALREVSMILAPASPRASAICRPRPREPPVTRATWPVRSNRAWTGVLMGVLSGSEAIGRDLWAQRLAPRHDIQPGADLGEFVGEEEAGRRTLAFGKRAAALHGQHHVQPQPGQHGMPEGLQIGHGIGQRLFGLTGAPG